MGRTPSAAASGAADVLEGEVVQITFAGGESDFAVVQVEPAAGGGTATACGPLGAVHPGQRVRLRGRWERHPRYGRQFRVDEGETFAPVTADGIRRYLASGAIPGLGEKIAGRIVDHFGAGTLDVVGEDPERLTEVRGIGKKTLARIRKAWAEQAAIRNTMVFLQSHGVSPGLAGRILKAYGNAAVARVRADPYRLSADVPGVGFHTADGIARRLGYAEDSAPRAAGALIHALGEFADQGHVCYPQDLLAAHVQRMLGGPSASLTEAVAREAAAGRIVMEEPAAQAPRAVYLKALHHCEVQLAAGLRRLAAAPRAALAASDGGALDAVERRMGIRLAARQREAVEKALRDNLLVVTGGPGTGKTTIVQAILELHRLAERRVRLAAPTGRAAKRLAESTGREACTIHRLLEFSPQKGGFQRDAERPLKADLLVVDEASMIDTVLMYHLVRALAFGTALVLVGDVHQLPAVGPGNVLGDLIASRVVPVVVLDEIFRQARRSRIIVNSHRINAGRNPSLDADDPASDFYFIERTEPEAALETIVHLVARRIPASRFDLDPMGDIQVISPMHRGVVGAENLNRRLQEALNPGPEVLVRGERRWRIGDKVMQIRNDYDKDVFNGDIGQIAAAAEDRLTVVFDGRPVDYEPARLDDLVLAYAISVHKSQGSEYPCIVLPLLTQHYVMLQRNLLYTAVTRARRLVVLVGDRRAMTLAVKNDRPQQRFTRLAERLAGDFA